MTVLVGIGVIRIIIITSIICHGCNGCNGNGSGMCTRINM